MAFGRRIIFGSDARQRVYEGIEIAERAVSTTLGPKGKNVLIDNGTNEPEVTKDGVTVAEAVTSSDKYINLGMTLAKNVARNVNKRAGDGTTTTTVIFNALCRNGLQLINSGSEAYSVMKGFRTASKDVIEGLDKYKKVIKDRNDILHIATISANNDPDIGELITQAYEGVGDDGLVAMSQSYARKSHIEFSKGFELFGVHYASSEFINNRTTETRDIENAKVYLSAKQVDDVTGITYKLLAESEKDEVVLIAPSFSEGVVACCEKQITFNSNKPHKICLVELGDGTPKMLRDKLFDIAAVTGAPILGIDETDYKNLKFGVLKSAKIGANKTVFEVDDNRAEAIQKYVESLKKVIENRYDEHNPISAYEVKSINERIAKLLGGYAKIYVADTNNTNLQEQLQRYEDAINAVKAAITDGITLGGGIALLKTVDDLRKNPKLESTDPEVIAAYNFCLKAYEEPFKKIIESIEESPKYIASKIFENGKLECGFNAKTQQFVDDMFEEGVIDPILVTKTALEETVSFSTQLLMTDCVINDEDSALSKAPNDPILARNH